ncbi:MAG: bifunctional diguanylate cyclase/phosphodiesterase, partial [Gudongella sp.]|nr:bifunctional diguanylate cyclase/phosphodiesterase [Gudongella sp.]
SHFTELFNYTFDEIHGKSIKLIAPDALAREMESNFSAINSGKIVKSRGLRLPKGGLPVELDILGYPIVHGNRVESTFMLYVRPSNKSRHPGYASLLSAVGNEYVRENPPVHAPVIDLKTTDWLTGFYSRTTFIETLEQTVERVKNVGGKLALMAIDIENFKEINDSLGHVTGDEILASLGRRISAVIPNDSLVSRFNGDDYFVSFLFDDYDEVKKIAGDILEMSEAPYDIGHSSVHLKVNIGVCYIPDHATDVQTAIRYANIAEYRTTKQGNERISFYSEEMSAEIEDNFYITNFLMEAIERNELSMHYQPIIDLTTDKIIGVEALMRWKNKVLGDVSPDRFIPVAEKSGKIYEMGEWALEEVCRQIMHWKSRNIDNIHVSVNASIKQLEKRDFAERCIGLIDKYGVDARSIEIEITESVSTGDVASIVRNLRGLKQKGFSIAMDDFGTGFSSLGQLEVFELDKLKIDKIFVDGMVSDPRKQNLVKAIIAMAGSLNLQVVAEGIEEKEQLEYLKRFGCELGQGYLFSRPLQKDRFEAFYWKFEC